MIALQQLKNNSPTWTYRFILEASLIRHIERRSVAITYRCRSCDKVLLFYNRCALLAHLRSHSIAEYDSDEEEAEEDIVLSSDAVKGEEVSSNVDVEPDSLAMCSLPKEKYLVGPLDDLPMDKDGRLIRKRKKAKKIKTSCANTQVTDYHIDQCMAEVNSALMLGILQSPKSNHINLEIIKTKEKEAADVEIAAKIKDKNHPSATSEDYFVFTSHLRTDASLDKATELSGKCSFLLANAISIDTGT
ncbi:hypothetical protein C0J52_22420 [Blattella germanica]|nr:hypothetical protein C0J52_22420 [Blattella germanica]